MANVGALVHHLDRDGSMPTRALVATVQVICLSTCQLIVVLVSAQGHIKS